MRLPIPNDKEVQELKKLAKGHFGMEMTDEEALRRRDSSRPLLCADEPGAFQAVPTRRANILSALSIPLGWMGLPRFDFKPLLAMTEQISRSL